MRPNKWSRLCLRFELRVPSVFFKGMVKACLVSRRHLRGFQGVIANFSEATETPEPSCILTMPANQIMKRILPRTFCQWKSPPTLACSI